MKKPKAALPVESLNNPMKSNKWMKDMEDVPYEEGRSTDDEGEEDLDGVLPMVLGTPRRSGQVRRAPKLADGRCVSPVRSKGDK